MSNKLGNLKPERVFYYFEELSKIPRESGNEKAVSNFLVETAKKLGLEVYQDKINNVIIKKAATKGYENSDGIILQGHMDMVCVKNLESNHNFLTDGLDLIVEGNILKANGTTLGADNGIAVAMGLAILEDNSLEHPQIELLVTVEEETTMRGAMELEDDVLTGKMLINIDSEEEGWITAGSAGGKGITITFEDKKINIDPSKLEFYRVEFYNFQGGHSGMEINKDRLNAIKGLNQVIKLARSMYYPEDIILCDIKGGSKDNAIPTECYVDIAINKDISENFTDDMRNMCRNYQCFDAGHKEKEMKFNFERLETEYAQGYADEVFTRVLNLIDETPTGVNTWITKKIEGLVESSDNLAIVKVVDEQINITISLRSSKADVLNDLQNKITGIAEKYGAKYKISGGYPGWDFKKESHLRETAVKVYEDLFNEKMQINVIHAGLECGAIAMHYPDLDMISIGPNIYDVHTSSEKMEIASVEKYYKYVVELLKKLK